MAELRVKGTGTLKLFESDNTSSVTIASPQVWVVTEQSHFLTQVLHLQAELCWQRMVQEPV